MIIDDNVLGLYSEKDLPALKWESIYEHILELSGKVIKMVIIFLLKAGSILAVNFSIAYLPADSHQIDH